jgi:hypothetical protein
MVNKIVKIQLYVLIVLLCIYGLAFWSISNDQKRQQQEISNQLPAPEGKQFLPYCEGGVSETIIDNDDTSCLAEKPGDFAKIGLATYAIIIFLTTPIFSFLFLVKPWKYSSK